MTIEELYNIIMQLHKGIGIRKRNNKYESAIKYEGANIHIGTFSSKEEAQKRTTDKRLSIFIENIYKYGEALDNIRYNYEHKCFVSKSGNLFNKQGKIYVLNAGRDGYLRTTLNRRTVDAHRVIAKTFLKEVEGKKCINHIDGNKTNNRVENLEWCNHSENTLHAYQTGLESKVFGEKHHNHKLTKENVKFIRENYKHRDSEYGITALAKKFNVDTSTIRAVINNETWRENI